MKTGIKEQLQRANSEDELAAIIRKTSNWHFVKAATTRRWLRIMKRRLAEVTADKETKA